MSMRAQAARQLSGSPSVTHTCSATDRAFIDAASLNLTSLGAWSGNGDLSDLAHEARASAARVDAISPTDPSLQQTRRALSGMFSEYARAVQAKVRNRDASSHLYRAYGLAAFARDLVLQAKPGLLERGCDVSPLL
jgi:hypothetical protein